MLESQADRGGLSPNLPAAPKTQDPESDPSLQTQTTAEQQKEDKKIFFYNIYLCSIELVPIYFFTSFSCLIYLARTQ